MDLEENNSSNHIAENLDNCVENMEIEPTPDPVEYMDCAQVPEQKFLSNWQPMEIDEVENSHGDDVDMMECGDDQNARSNNAYLDLAKPIIDPPPNDQDFETTVNAQDANGVVLAFNNQSTPPPPAPRKLALRRSVLGPCNRPQHAPPSPAVRRRLST